MINCTQKASQKDSINELKSNVWMVVDGYKELSW